MNIALIAHDKLKESIIKFSKEYTSVLKEHSLYGTGTTGKKIMENTELNITRLKSGPLGGDQQIGAMVAKGEIDMIFFFRDPLTSQPHEPDITALLRLADVYKIAVATNIETATRLVKTI